MKATIIILLLGFTFSFNPGNSMKYALTYCNHYNPKYHYYKDRGEDAHFVSQCLVAGGQNFDGCNGRDGKGMILSVSNLKTCLLSKGWKSSDKKPASFKMGYPIFFKNCLHAMIATGFDGDNVVFCAHDRDRCNAKIKATSVDYYYL